MIHGATCEARLGARDIESRAIRGRDLHARRFDTVTVGGDGDTRQRLHVGLRVDERC